MNALPHASKVLTAASLMLLSACTHLSGLDGETRYACKAPVGVACDSVSGTYANAVHNRLPLQSRQTGTETSIPNPGPVASSRPALEPALSVAPKDTTTPTDLRPLRSQARVLRLWTKPWEDADGDLYDQGYVYVQVDNGQWLIDHVQRQIRDAHAPVRPPPKAVNEMNTDPARGSAKPVGISLPSRTLPGDSPTPIDPPWLDKPPSTSFNRTQ